MKLVILLTKLIKLSILLLLTEKRTTITWKVETTTFFDGTGWAGCPYWKQHFVEYLKHNQQFSKLR
jgi:hypothetical protein